MKLESLARVYQAIQLVAVALSPSFAIWYLASFSALPPPLFEDHLFHEMAIALATLIGGFVSYVSWRSYQASGEVFLRWLTVGLLAFTLIYAPHGLLTRTAHHNIWLFLLYGPVSRLVMLGCMVYGLVHYGKTAENPATLAARGFWRNVILACAAIVVAVGVLAYSPIASSPWLRIPMESGAAVLCLGAVGMMIHRQIRSPLMVYYAMALMFFAQAALAFILAKPWNHMWWLAHAIFASGFSIVGWGVVRALLTTRSFAHAFSAEQLMRALEDEKDQLGKMVDALQRSDARLKSVFDASPDALLISDAQGRIIMGNRQVNPLLGYSVDELLGQSIDILVPDQKRTKHAGLRESYCLASNLHAMRQGLVEASARRKDGSEFPVEISLSQIESGGSFLVASAMRDVTERKRMEKELRNFAFSDALTQLPNRRQLMDRLKHALRVCKRHYSYGAVLFLDLNKFKLLNDTYGHDVGDQLLIEVAKRLKNLTRDTDTVARLGGDEFVVLLEDIDKEASKAALHAAHVLEKISLSLADEYVLGSIRHHGTASIGFTLFSGADTDIDQIIKNADAAMYASKKTSAAPQNPA